MNYITSEGFRYGELQQFREFLSRCTPKQMRYLENEIAVVRVRRRDGRE